jgi:hypothetical protein
LAKFSEFWVLYLRAHRMPGTRALHYFATAIGIMSVGEAVLGRQPVFLLGIGLGYAIAIGSHWFIERNRPLIRINALWGAVADMRLCWAAMTGRLGREIAAIDADRARFAGPATLWIAPPIRWVLPLASAAGLAGALLDLGDLEESGIGLYYALVQVGGPILTFAAALIAALCAIGPGFARKSAAEDLSISSTEGSLWCACGIMLALGAGTTIAAELVEDGFSLSLQVYVSLGIILTVIAVAPALLLARPRLRV